MCAMQARKTCLPRRTRWLQSAAHLPRRVGRWWWWWVGDMLYMWVYHYNLLLCASSLEILLLLSCPAFHPSGIIDHNVHHCSYESFPSTYTAAAKCGMKTRLVPFPPTCCSSRNKMHEMRRADEDRNETRKPNLFLRCRYRNAPIQQAQSHTTITPPNIREELQRLPSRRTFQNFVWKA